MAIDTIVQIVMRAKDEASKTLAQVSGNLQKTQAQTAQTNRSLQGALTMGANVAKAGLIGLAGAGAMVGAALVSLESDLGQAASGIAGIAGLTSDSIPLINAQLKSLVGANDNAAKEVGDALKTVYTSFKIFDTKDPKGIAQILLDWKDVTGASFDEAAKGFRRIVMTYFGADADISKVLPDIADKILKVAQAVGIEPKGLAAALAAGGPTFKTAFGNMNEALAFLASIGAAGGDIEGASKAVTTFLEKVKDIRDAWKNDKTPDAATLEAFKTLGLSQETVQNQSIKVGTLITSALKTAMKDGKLTDDELSSLNFLFGARVGEDMALASTKFPEFNAAAREALNDYKGALEEAAQVTDDNVNARIATAWNSLVVTISDSTQWEGIKESFEGLITTIEGVLKNDWTPTLKGLGTIGTGIFKTLLGVDPAAVAEALVWWWDDVITPEVDKFNKDALGWIGGLFEPITDGILVGLFGTTTDTTADIIVGWWDATVAPELVKFNADAFGWATEKISAIGDGIFTLLLGATPASTADAIVFWWDTNIAPELEKFNTDAFGWIGQKLNALGDSIFTLLVGGTPANTATALAAWWNTNIAPELEKFKGNPLKWITEKLTAIGDSVFTFLLGGTLANTTTALTAWWNTNIAPELEKFKGNPLKWITEKLGTIGNGIFTFLLGTEPTKVTSSLSGWWDDSVMPLIKKFALNPLDWATSQIATIANNLFKTLLGANAAEVVTNLKNWWDTTAYPKIKEFPTSVLTWLKTGLTAIGDSFFKLLFGATTAQILASVKSWWDVTVYPQIKDFFAEPVKLIGAVGGQLWEGIKSGFKAAVDGAAGVTVWLTNRWGDIKTGFDLWLPLLTTWAGGLWDSIRNGFNAAWTSATGVAAWVGNRWTDLKNFFTEAFFGKDGKGGILLIGGQLMQGLIDGMGNFMKALQTQVNKIGGDTLKWFKDAFGIKSPSTEMMEVGDFIMKGLSDGISAALGDTFAKVQDVSGKLLTGFQKLGTDLDKLFKGEYAGVFSSMGDTILGTLTDLGVGMDPVLKANIKAFASYADQFTGLLQKYKGNVLAALGDLLIGIIEQKVIELTIWGAVEVGKAALSGFLSFGATALLIPAIIGAGALAIGGLESLKGSIRSSYGSFDVGTPYVPQDQLAQIHKGEMIVPATFAEGIRRGDMALGDGGNSKTPVYVQVILDGRMVAEVMGNRFQDGIRQLVRADLRTISG